MALKNNEADSHDKFSLAMAFIDRNVLKNVRFYYLSFLFLLALLVHHISEQNDILGKMEKDNASSYKSVIGLTTDGRVIGIERSEVDAENLKIVIARALRDSFIVSRRELTKNYTVASFESEEDILKNSPRLKSAFDDYIYFGDPATLSDEDKTMQGESAKYFSAYLKYLLIALNTNNLPHFINITDMSVVGFSSEKNKFTIRVQLPCQTQSVDNAGRTVDQQGVNELYAEGMFDITKRTATNPFGLKIVPKAINIVEIHAKTNVNGYSVQDSKGGM